MAAGIKLGHTNVHYDLVTNIPVYKQKVQHDTKATDFLKEWITKHPTFRAKEAVTHFDLHGRTAGAAYTGLRVLVEEGVLKKLGEGQYVRKDAYLPKQTKKKAEAKKAPARHEVPHPDYVMKHVKRRSSFTRDEVIHLLKRDKRTPSSVGGTLSTLLKRGDIERTGKSEYKPVVKSGGNGAATEAVEASHG